MSLWRIYTTLYILKVQLGYTGAELEEYVKARRIKEARERIKDWESFKKSIPNSQRVLVDYIVYCQERKIIPVDGTSPDNVIAMTSAGYTKSMTINEYIKKVNLSKTDQKDLESWKVVSYSYVAYELYTTVGSYYKAGKIISAKNTKKKIKASDQELLEWNGKLDSSDYINQDLGFKQNAETTKRIEEIKSTIIDKNGNLTVKKSISNKNTIPGEKLKNEELKKYLTRDGSDISDWQKVSTDDINDGILPKYQIHWYENKKTGKVELNYDFKIKFKKENKSIYLKPLKK